MFEPLPDPGGSFGWITSDAISELQVRHAILHALDLEEKLEALSQKAASQSAGEPDPELTSSLAMEATYQQRIDAGLARVNAILLTSMHIEGAINAWGAVCVGEDFFKRHIERSQLESKLALILALSGKGRIPRDHETLVRARRLFERRNQLAHPKTKELKSLSGVDVGPPANDLTLCDEAFRSFHRLLRSAAPSVVAILVAGKDVLSQPNKAMQTDAASRRR